MKVRAIHMLDRVIEDTTPLFRVDPQTIEEKRIALQCKLDLLRELGRITEALAWICLECELHPTDVTALALKKSLKAELGFPRDTTERPEQAGTLSGNRQSKWDGLAGMRELKAMFERDVILPLRYPQLYEQYKIPIPNGILLYGPPGCGKTFFVRTAAKLLGYSFIEIKPSTLASPYVHETQRLIGEMFKSAVEKAPCLLFIDEIEAFVPNRSERSVGHHYSSEVNEFLAQLNECSKRRILVVGATNLIGNIDPAVLRPGRMDKKLFVGTPDFESRIEAFRIHMKDRPQNQIDWEGLGEQSECYTFAEIEHVVNEAARSALDRREPISHDHLIDALTSNPAAHTYEQIEAMRKRDL